MKIAEKVLNLLRDEASIKIISTMSDDHQIHTIVAGSVMVIDEETLGVAQIFMNTTAANIEHNKDVAILVVKGLESYLISARAQDRLTDGAIYHNVASVMEKNHMQVQSVLTYQALEVFNQSASQDDGKKVIS